MNIIKEERKIILELSAEEDEVVNYFIRHRELGTAILYEYFNHWMAGRRETKRAEEHRILNDKWDALSKEEQIRMFGGIIKNG